MRFQMLLARKIDEVQSFEAPFRCAVLRYKFLKKFLASLDAGTGKFIRGPLGADKHKSHEENCCICFEPFDAVFGSNVKTSCGHDFHLNCLVKSLSMCSCCPLCRCPAAELVPGGVDGECIRFMAMMEVNINAVHHCHEYFIFSLHRRMKLLLSDSLPKHESETSIVRRLGEYEKELDLLNATTEFCCINAEGFRKIAKKFDKQTLSRYRVTEAVLASLRMRPFYADALSPNGSCRLALLQERLLSLVANAEAALARSAATPRM